MEKDIQGSIPSSPIVTIKYIYIGNIYIYFFCIFGVTTAHYEDNLVRDSSVEDGSFLLMHADSK